jgi:very-short-patch-repair endonuclease
LVIASGIGADLIKRIQNTRRELLDLSARNRLISTPRESSRGKKVEIVDERSEAVFRLLVRERKSMSFLSGPEELEIGVAGAAGSPLLTQPDEPSKSDGTPDARHVDLRLQTRLGSERLQSRLLSIYYDAQTYEQEQGVSILYLAMGFLKWYESPSSDKARYAPLLLIPVDLRRQTAASRFHLEYRDEDITTNLSLQAKLKGEFGINLPEVPDMDDLTAGAYFNSVALAVADQSRWAVLPDDMLIWFFSFAKYLMYRDLDPMTWPDHSPLGTNRTLSRVLGEGFIAEPSLCDENDKIDPLIPPINMVHVTDADSSQTIAIEEVRLGRNLVIQGPPGTGKSQTITNLIATAVRAGKKILFVAEKMSALEVVHNRLERLGLGSICLELHSSKANKKIVLEEIARTLALGRPKPHWSEERLESLQAAIDHLNCHAEVMNTPIEPAGVTPYQVIGRLARLYARGIEATTFPLPEPESWSGSKFRDHCRGLADLQEHLAEIGSLSDHPWKGVSRTEPLLPTDRKELQTRVAEAVSCLNGAIEAFDALLSAFDDARLSTPSLRDVQQIAQFALRLTKAPEMDSRAIGNAVWQARGEEIGGLVEQGRLNSKCVLQLEPILHESAWQADLAQIRQPLSIHGRSLFRWFRADFRGAVAALRAIVKSKPPRSLAERLEFVDKVIEVRGVARSLDHDSAVTQLGREAFGDAWKGSKSDWNALARVVKWDSDCRGDRTRWNHRGILARLDRSETLQNPLRKVSATLKPASAQLHDLANLLSLNITEAFGIEKLNAVPIADLLARLKRWQENPESLSKWIGYQMRRRRLDESGLRAIVAGIQEGQILPSSAVDQFQVAYYQTLIRDVFRRHRDLAEFDGRSYEQWIAEFQSLDQQRIEMARGEVATAHYDSIPRSAVGGEMAVLRREFEKKRKHKPIRQLIKEAGTAILAIKPVFMMSPISVAQFLEPGSVTFDLLLIDEASQVSPVDALGAMARAAQVVVVGDDKQLPPTRFFSKMLDDDEVQSDGDDVNAGDLESILGLCLAQGICQRMLRWHYRSRHHSLIAVSNREFYDNRLFVVPSPTTITAMHGLHFRLVKNGIFDRGNSATNRVEARAVAAAVVEHSQRYPQQSLGVGAFSVAQRDAIRDEVEVLQRNHPELAPFFSSGRPDPFFVKNLENIQGDERDVIFISVGYARDKSGYMAMNFGPLSSQGGERRLNVLISRARERCEVFSSITADDIDLQRAKSRGAAAFKTFLRFAATGIMDAQAPTHREHDSDFEQQVESALEGLGYQVHRQIGTSGFIIDLAIVDPAKPGRYLLGIECDGATYHSARSARDRDRLRETVLKDRGWKIHRIWSTDWFHRPAEQLQKIASAIEKARVDWECDEAAPDDHEAPVGDCDDSQTETEIEIERNPEPDVTKGESHFPWACPYVESTQDVPSSTPIPETRTAILEAVLTTLVEIEGPIHRDEIARRITALWGLQRIGPRIAEAISTAIEAAVHSGRLSAERDFITHPGLSIVTVRDRSQVTATSLKKAEMIAPSEVRQAIVYFVKEQVGLRREELPMMVSKVLGFKTTSSKLKELVDKTLTSMLEAGDITSRDDKLFFA